MSRLPDGTNAYGRILDVMSKSAPKQKGLVLGEYLGDGSFLVGDQTLESGDYYLIQNELTIDDWTFVLPGLEEQTHTVERSVTHPYTGAEESFEFDIVIPGLQAGDNVIAYQIGTEDYIILGKAVS